MVRNGERAPILDRIANDGKLEYGGKVLSKAVAAVVAFVLLASILSLLIGMDISGDQRVPAKISYFFHYPFQIDGNAAFAITNGTVGGTGIESDPYIIDGWDINVFDTGIDGICISNTNVFFIIQNCYIHIAGTQGGPIPKAGIYLNNVTNGLIQGNNCSNNCIKGIELVSSNHNTVTNNICMLNNVHGISLSSSNNNVINNNICSSNPANGIFLYFSNNNTLNGNTCLNSTGGSGIGFNTGINNTLIGNNCSMGNQQGMSLSGGNCTLSYNICLNNDYGIYMENMENNTITNNTCSNNICGLYLYGGHNNTIGNNDCSDNSDTGIDLRSADSNLFNNTISNNTAYGLYCCGGGNTIWNNTFYHNNGTGDLDDPIHIQACDDGMNNYWSSSDGYGNWWSDWTTPDSVSPWGIVDNPYNISGSAGAKDSFPLVTYPYSPIPEFSDLIVPMLGIIGLFFLLRGRRSKS